MSKDKKAPRWSKTETEKLRKYFDSVSDNKTKAVTIDNNAVDLLHSTEFADRPLVDF